MNSYLRDAHPSRIERFLQMLGLYEPLRKVNCWYCNYDTFLFPGSKETIYRWYCHLCDNLNVRDENGEVVDPTFPQFDWHTGKTEVSDPPPLHYVPLDSTGNSVPRYGRTPLIHSFKDPYKMLCEKCDISQHVAYASMRVYTRDDYGPGYEERLENAHRHEALVNSWYPLCGDCRWKLELLEKEQIALFGEEQAAAIRARKLSDATPKSKPREVWDGPNEYVFAFQRRCWKFIHAFTILAFLDFIVHETAVAFPSAAISDYLQGTYILGLDILQNRDTMIQRIGQLIVQGLLSASDIFISAFNTTVSTLICLLGGDRKHCYIGNSYAWFELTIAFNALSLGWMNWHIIRRQFPNRRRLKNWGLYTKCQFVLWCIRFLLIGLIRYHPNPTILLPLFVVYLLLLSPFFLIRAEKGYLLSPDPRKRLKNLKFDDEDRQGVWSRIRRKFGKQQQKQQQQPQQQQQQQKPDDYIDEIDRAFNNMRISQY